MTVNDVSTEKESRAHSSSRTGDEDEGLSDRFAGLELLLYASRGALTQIRDKLASLGQEKQQALVNFTDSDSRTALHIACSDGHVAVVKELLRNGADPRITDRSGYTCVDDALRNGRIEVLRVLGDFGAAFPNHVDATDVNPGYKLGRDLCQAAAEGNVRAAQQLVYTFGANGK